jgi:hypothetical protein
MVIEPIDSQKSLPFSEIERITNVVAHALREEDFLLGALYYPVPSSLLWPLFFQVRG